jgi:hypothetical protein
MTKRWKQPKCSSTDEWIKKNVKNKLILEYYVALKRRKFYKVRIAEDT